MIGAWLQFAACAALILAAGPVLIRQAQSLASMYGWSRTWVGGILLAAATSLPELITGLSAVSVANAPNIAVGDALGSCIFNLALLALLDLLCREDSVFSHADQGHVLTAALGTFMIGVTGAGLLTASAGLDVVVGHVSVHSLLLLLLYAVVVRALFLFGKKRPGTAAETATSPRSGRPLLYFFLAAVIVAVAGAWLPMAGNAIVEQTGWRSSFVGTLVVAAATSFPELVVMIAALRMRSVDLAIAGLLGSNIFDIAIIAIDDIAYAKGSLFANVSPSHAGTAFGAVVMSSLVIAGIIDRPRVRVFGRIGWVSILLTAVYAITAYSIFLHG